MLISPQEVYEALQGHGGTLFESCVRDIIRAEAKLHEIPPTHIDWDFRTNVPDGGCDVFINHEHDQPNPRLIPNLPSLWSIKSGRDGILPSKLRTEILDHQRVVDHLKGGDFYVWCALNPIDQGARLAMREKVDELAGEVGFKAEQVVFVWIETIQDLLENYPNLIAAYAPRVAQRIRGVEVFRYWGPEGFDRQGYEVEWVEFSGRSAVKDRIAAHLRGGGESALLHIAGFSGIGKTRTVFQACQDDPELHGVLYFPRLSEVDPDFLRFIENGGASVTLVIDEVSLKEYYSLCAQFGQLADRVRVVTIGPARRGEQGKISEPELLVLAPPSREEALLPIIRSAAHGLDETVIASIAEMSGSDIRLALLLVFATLNKAEFQLAPIVQIDEVLDRITHLFAGALLDVDEFKRTYETLTFAIDIGCEGKFRNEIEFVSEFFELPLTRLDRTVGMANDCGLGIKTPQFFEAMPRALAIRIFKDRFWMVLQPRVNEFLEQAPTDRLKRRFLERCQEVDGPGREEVLESVGVFFSQYLGDPVISRIRDGEKSRVFQAWAELDPDRGLRWLSRAIDGSSDDDIREMDRFSSSFGGWSGRRQVVWLCEHLACFEQYFEYCEAVLYRLAQVETEESIGNNSRNTWAALFMPILSNTQKPFADRLEILNQRLGRASESTLELLMLAFMQVFQDPGGRIAPPKVVGGRLVPDEWRPATWEELGAVREKALELLVKTIVQLDSSLARICAISIAEHLREITKIGRVDLLSSFFDEMLGDSRVSRKLLQAIDETISIVELQNKDRQLPPIYDELTAWRDRLAPRSLEEQIIDITGREYWQVYRSLGRKHGLDEPVEAYVDLAESTLEKPEVINELREWFDSVECRSGGALGLQLGSLDGEKALFETMLDWLRDGEGGDVPHGYVSGLTKTKGMDPHVTEFLDESVEINPDMVVRISLTVDISMPGIRRVLSCVGVSSPETIQMLRSVAYPDWRDVLGGEIRVEILDALLDAYNQGSRIALETSFFVVGHWYHSVRDGIEAPILELVQRLLLVEHDSEVNTDSHNWKTLVEVVLPTFPDTMADLLADTLTDGGVHRFQRSDYAEELLVRLAADHPELAMESIGKFVMDPERGIRFRIFEYRGLFDAIGFPVVRDWLMAGRGEYAVNIARHLNGPSLDEDGKPVLPELADWLLSEYPDDKVFAEFCMGRHSGVTRVGHSRERIAEVQKILKPFEGTDQEWVKKWIQYEKDSLKSEIRNDDRIHDEFDRT